MVDTTPPVITLIGDATTTHPASTPYVDQGANWTDLVDGNGSINGSGTVDHNTPGIYQITYNYTDQAGNAAQTIYRSVQVVDQQAPVITLLGDSDITHEAGTTFIDAGAYWSDSVDGNGTANANATVDENVPGTYTINYSFTDSSGNEAQSITRTIEVIDTTPPVITLIGDANITHPIGLIYSDSGATWTDAVDGQGIAQTEGQVDITEPGIYSITYHASDKSGNFALSTSRTVEVVNQRPEFTIDPISIPENEGFATDLHASDLDINQSLTFAIIGGADESFFMLNAITGTLSFIASPDYENPMDADSDNRYEVILAVSDGHDSTESPFIIKITDVWENQAPTGISLSSSSIYENLPAGSHAGFFSTEDPDANDTFIYSLISLYSEENITVPYSISLGEENATNKQESLFQLDMNGSISTTRPLDYETDPTFTLLGIRVEDREGASLEQWFEIELLNVVEDLDKDGTEDAHDDDRDGDGFSNEEEVLNGTDPDNFYSQTEKPIVTVREALLEDNGSILLSGEISFDGDGEVLDYGFVLSSRISLDVNKSEVYWVRGIGSPSEFILDVNEHPFTGIFYYRAWARNAAGYGISSVKKFIIPEEPQTWWGEITDHEGGWKTSDWFGTFRYYEKGWMFHTEFGWLYTSPDQTGGVWIWTTERGWLWTNQTIWPYLFQHSSLSWLYYTSRENGQGLFYDFSTSSYDLPQGGVNSVPATEENGL